MLTAGLIRPYRNAAFLPAMPFRYFWVVAGESPVIDSATVSRRFRGRTPDAHSIRHADLGEADGSASENGSGTTRVVALVEGSRLQAAGFAALLAGFSPEITVLAVPRDIAGCRREIDRDRPDIAILNVRTVRPELVRLLRYLQERGDQVRPVMLAESLDPQCVGRVLGLGLGGLLSADLEPADLLNALRVLRAGRMILDPAVVPYLVNGACDMNGVQGRAPATTPAGLTSAELEILRLAAEGLGNDEIAQRLAISTSTLKRNLRLIVGKLPARDRTSAVVAAVRAGLI
ncbi:MAG: hypothetical protein GEV11_24090 [Streptosporangiales bacterium]|nr:hypothetical protein [Streptosporangiales bacterium]